MKKTIHKSRGFTLIELMIVLTIAAILMAVGYPAYKQYITKARRVDAGANLLELAQYMERFFTENGRYDQDTGGTAVSLPYNKSPKEGTTTFYNITMPAVSSTAFTLQATPTGDQASDTECGALTINSTGVKCIKAGASCSNNASASVQQAVRDCW
jgi:type IV pilus assembly protein PilE